MTEYSSSHPVTPSPRHPVTPTPYWYPCQTNAGAIREDRLVFPIPPGTHWTEVQAVAIAPATAPALDSPGAEAPRAKAPRKVKPKAPPAPLTTASFSLRFGPPPAPPKAKGPKRERVEKPTCPERSRRKVKIDPALVAKTRELRDRCLERFNDGLLIAPGGKYDVSRSLPAMSAVESPAMSAVESAPPDAPRALPNAA